MTPNLRNAPFLFFALPTKLLGAWRTTVAAEAEDAVYEGWAKFRWVVATTPLVGPPKNLFLFVVPYL